MANWIGTLIAIIAAIISNAGVNLQKSFHQKHESEGSNKKYYMHISWWYGFLLVCLAAIGDFVALMFASQSIVAAVGGGTTLVVNNIMAHYMNKERMFWTDAVGVGFIIIAVVILAIIVDPSKNYSIFELRRLLIQPMFIIYFILQILTILVIRGKGLSEAFNKNKVNQIYNVQEIMNNEEDINNPIIESNKDISTIQELDPPSCRFSFMSNYVPGSNSNKRSHSMIHLNRPESLSNFHNRTLSRSSTSNIYVRSQTNQIGEVNTQNIQDNTKLKVDLFDFSPLTSIFSCCTLKKTKNKHKNKNNINNHKNHSINSIESSEEDEEEDKRSFFIRYATFSFAAISGMVGALSVLISKCTAEVIRTSADGNAEQLKYPDLYLYLAGMVITIIIQTHYLNQAIAAGDVTTAFPIFQAFWISFSVIGGIIFYQEIKHFTIFQWIFYIICLFFMIIGISFLLQHQKQELLYEIKENNDNKNILSNIMKTDSSNLLLLFNENNNTNNKMTRLKEPLLDNHLS